MASQLTDREWALWRAVGLMTRQVQTTLEHRLQEDAGISRADYEILHALDAAEAHQARARDLATMLGWEKSRISHQVTRMVSRGLVERTECATDLRGSWVALATEGRIALRNARPGYERALRRHFLGQLTDDEADALTEQALRVVAAGDPTMCQEELAAIREAARRAAGARVTG